MNWLQKAATPKRKPEIVNIDLSRNDDEQSAAAETYFSIGHGDFNEESGYEPKYLSWVYLNGQVRISKTSDPNGTDDCLTTHGILWGHDVCNESFKGRYEPQTGQISIVIPDRLKFRDVPNGVMADLYRKFPNISKVTVFR